MSLLDAVSQCEFLRSIPAAFIVRLNQIAQIRGYSPGATLFREGTEHPEFHILAEGHVRLDMQVPGRGRVPILTTEKGDILAWSTLVGNSIMTSTGVALDRVKTVAIPGHQLKQLCETEHEIGYHVMKQLASAVSRRLLATRLQLLDLFGDHVPVLDSSPIGPPGDVQC